MRSFNLKNKILYFRPLKIITLYLSMLIPKKRNLMLFGSWFGNKYADNPKYLYEYIINNKKDISAIWMTSNLDIYSLLKNEKKPVCKSFSLQAVWLALRAKYIFYCTDEINDIGVLGSHFIGNSICVNLWHGVGGGKKIGLDDREWRKILLSPQNRICEKFESIPLRKKYMVCTSDEMKRVFKSAFLIQDKYFIMAGQTRNDMFYDKHYKYQTIDISAFKGKRIILYMPTHRKLGKQRIEISKLFDLDKLESFLEENNCLFFVKKHFYHINEIENFKKYPNIKDITKENVDTNELLKASTCLISDYSSVTADYLLLDRPIFYYCFDLNEYQQTDRDLYWNYDEITPGSISENFDNLLCCLKNFIEKGCDDFSLERTRVKNMFYNVENQKKAADKVLRKVLEIK